MKKLELFHRIGEGGADSAVIRSYLVEHNLTAQVEFRNLAFESHQAALAKLAPGLTVAPILVVDGAKVISGKAEILAWLAEYLKPAGG